jgi:hypothetical protein
MQLCGKYDSVTLFATIGTEGYSDDAFSVALAITLLGAVQNAVPLILYNMRKSRAQETTLVSQCVLLIPFMLVVVLFGLVCRFNTGGDAGVVRSIGLLVMIVGFTSPIVAIALNALMWKKWFYWSGAAVSAIALVLSPAIARL